MPKQLFLFFILLVSSSCSNEPLGTVQWGPEPRQSCGDWLTFDYDQAIYFHDSTGTLWQSVSNDTSLNKYILSHSGKALSADNIKNLGKILSCKLFCGAPEDSVFVAVNNPEHLVTFFKNKKLSGYVSVDFNSGKIYSRPATRSEELCALKYLFQAIRQQ